MKNFTSIPLLLLLLSIPVSLFAKQQTALNAEEQVVPLSFNDPEEAAFTSRPKGRLSIRIDNIRNVKGKIGIALFTGEKGFPDKPEKAFAVASTAINGASQEIVIENIPYGTYAVSILHDENENKKMDKTWIGKPKEGFGASNNPKIRFGPPGFDESGFDLDCEEIALDISINYL